MFMIMFSYLLFSSHMVVRSSQLLTSWYFFGLFQFYHNNNFLDLKLVGATFFILQFLPTSVVLKYNRF